MDWDGKFREYPHETAFRLKREAASELYDAVAALIDCEDEAEPFSALGKYDNAVALARVAFAKANGK